MSMNCLNIIVGGYIGLYPTGGAAWDYLQYPLGLQMLGHNVYYIEDTLQYPLFQKQGDSWNDASFCIGHLKQVMETFGFKDKWAYRDIASQSCYGMSEAKIRQLCRDADVFINLSCSTFLRDEYLKIPKRILLDSDPMFTQIQYCIESENKAEAKDWTTKQMIENHTHLFTFGENINQPDCRIPLLGFHWNTTRQPVCLQLWEPAQKNSGSTFTSVMNWSGRKKIVFQDQEWGQKDVEFEKFKTLPSCLPNASFEIVMNRPLHRESNLNWDELTALKWKLVEPQFSVTDAASYKNFILNSTAEFSIAKETYVKSISGWFSCRSACYLAAGKPVITEETGWSKYIETGNGLFAFNNMESAMDAIEKVQSHLARHSAAAREMAIEYFDSNKILTQLLEKLN